MPYHIEVPDFGSLSTEQRRAVRHGGAIRLKGGPGTGKSLVSLWRALSDASGKTVLILTYTKSLEFYFRAMLQSARRGGNSKNIRIQRSQKSAFNSSTMLSDFFDEIILDEAQDMTENQLRLFAQKAHRVSFGADYRQQLYPDKGAKEELLCEILQVSRTFELNKNYRSTKQILKAVRAFFPTRGIPPEAIERSRDGATVKYRHTDFREEAKTACSVLREFIGKTEGNIGILVPSESKVEEVYETVSSINPGETTKYKSSDPHSSLDNMGRIHICTYKSSKGLEWDVVILPYFGGRDYWIENTQIQVNDHYVAMTRARNSLILISDNERDNKTLQDAYNTDSSQAIRTYESLYKSNPLLLPALTTYHFKLNQHQGWMSPQNRIMSEQTKLNLQPESKSIELSQIPAAADDEKSVFLMFEQIQFDLFERWIRLGLIFLDPTDSSEDDLYGGLPFSLVPVDSDVLIEVHLTREEFEKSELCGKDKNVGWLNPGLLPVTRIRKVLFKTHDLLVQAHNQMSIGSKVPEILKSYQAGDCWAVQDEPVMTKEEAFQALRQSSRDDEPSNIESSLEDWDYTYGRMSFLRSVATAFPSRIQGTILNHISHLVAGTWPGLDEVVKDFQISPADRNTIIKLSGISAEIKDTSN